MICPNKTAPEWKYLVSEIGENYSMRLFMANEGLPHIEECKRLVFKIKNFDRNFTVSNSFPFSKELQTRVNKGLQKYTVRTRQHDSGIYNVGKETYEINQIGNKPINISYFGNKDLFLEQFKGKDAFIRETHIQDFLEGKNNLYVYSINKLTPNPTLSVSQEEFNSLNEAEKEKLIEQTKICKPLA